ncbi:hypothetical protein DMX06_10935 [Pseudomonas mosselii]|nr:hypothetical protein DMX06_10935 [Pseudomonas mosselii]
MWERPCVAKGAHSAPRLRASIEIAGGCCAALSRHKAAPTGGSFPARQFGPKGWAISHANPTLP